MVFRSISSPRRRIFLTITSAAALLWLLAFASLQSWPRLGLSPIPPSISWGLSATQPAGALSASEMQDIEPIANYIIDHPLTPPYQELVGEMGERVQFLRKWMMLADIQGEGPHHDLLERTSEALAQSLFSFLNPLDNATPSFGAMTTPATSGPTAAPLDHLRTRVVPGSRGIVIPTGTRNLRYAAHLVVGLTRVLGTELPIQIAYAGEADLPAVQRGLLRSIVDEANQDQVSFLDVLHLFDDTALELINGGWAIKPFAALASQFEQVLLLDADAVLLQQPEVFFQIPRYRETGAFLFHDRLLWQNGFPERHAWWRRQIRHPSAEMNRSRVWTENYAEEGDSGAVIIDKGRLDVFLGLLHIAWQNELAVREEVTYRMTYGDKESWWLGFEVSGSHYAFEEHYGGIVGWEAPDESGDNKVCSFVIAHFDTNAELLWYNGGLPRNKLASPFEYAAPTHTMIDATWKKGATKADMSCMVGGKPRKLREDEQEKIWKLIEGAKEVDLALRSQTGLI